VNKNDARARRPRIPSDLDKLRHRSWTRKERQQGLRLEAKAFLPKIPFFCVILLGIPQKIAEIVGKRMKLDADGVGSE
jgi:hypothetical protein